MVGVRPLKVLISGAGIAGASLAGLLARDGHQVAVVERDQGTRSSGNPVDVRGPAYRIVDELGLLKQLRDLATRVRELVFVDTTGRRLASIPTRRSDREIEIARVDLCTSLVDAARGLAEFRFDDTITSLALEDGSVDVSFARWHPQRFDLVVGADGLHSTVRRLAFGPESDFVTHLGLYVATVPLPRASPSAETVVMYNEPGAAVAVHPGTGRPGAAFMFRNRRRVDPRDQAGVTELMTEVHRGMGWRTGELVGDYLAADDRYFDAVSRVRVRNWTRGRVVLLGDAASCVSLFGEGSSAAIVGAANLAHALGEQRSDVAGALLRYQAGHREFVRRGQRGAAVAARLLIPATQTGLALRNRTLRLAGRR